MDNKQIASSYAIAKILGYQNAVEFFIKEYSQYYNETYKILQSSLEPNKATVSQNPFRVNHDSDFL